MYSAVELNAQVFVWSLNKVSPKRSIRVIAEPLFSKVLLLKSQLAFICSKLTIETLEQGTMTSQWPRSGIFLVKFQYISHLVLVFLFLTLNM